MFAVLEKVFRERAERLPMLFDPQAPGIALRPSPAALKDCFGLLSLNPDALRNFRIRVKDENGNGDDPLSPFTDPDALGWAYQYWNTEEKDRVFEKVRTVKGAKIAGADIIPATQLYTESYMVKFLVQNSLGATWMGMHPESKLCESWEYYVKDADRAPIERKPVCEITFLDPACGSGHFLLEAFDLFDAMYQEEGELTAPEEICNAILTRNLFGIDIDERAVQIAEAALWMKAAERAFDYVGAATNLVAANIRLPRGTDHVQAFLGKHPEDYPLRFALPAIFEGLAHADELGSLLKTDEIIEAELAAMRKSDPLFAQSSAAEGWHDRVLDRLRTHFEAEAESPDLGAAFFSRSAGKGLKLFDLLIRRYDVVAANPPYMGSKNMGPVLKKYVERNFKAGKRDLYAAFILRNLQMVNEGGRVAMVTQQSWMFLRSFSDLRFAYEGTATVEDSARCSGIVCNTSIETLVHLGRYAFSEIGNAAVAPVIFVVRNQPPSTQHRVWACRLTAPRAAEEQALLIRQATLGQAAAAVFRPSQNEFTGIPNVPLVYYLRKEFFDLLRHDDRLGAHVSIRQGLATADKERFIRTVSEVPQTSRWRFAAHGGGYSRWWGPNNFVVEWEYNGARIKASPGVRVQSEHFYGRPGYWYAQVASGSLGLRRLLPGSLFTNISSGVFPIRASVDEVDECASLDAFLNTRIATYLLRSISQKIVFSEGYPPLLPWPPDLNCKSLVDFAHRCKAEEIAGTGVMDATYDPIACETLHHGGSHLRYVRICCLRHTVEACIETAVHLSFKLNEEALADVTQETGIPAGWFPLIVGYDTVQLISSDSLELPQEVLDGVAQHKRQALSKAELDQLRTRCRAIYESGPGNDTDVDADSLEATSDEDEEPIVSGAQIPIPTETLLEGMAQRLEVHPISAFLILEEGIRNGWRCLPEEQRLLADRVTLKVLRLLGHRWPKQVEAGELIPNWADPDGIIPLTPLANESTLVERVRERFSAKDIYASDFAEVMGKQLDSWLATEFFKHHTKQFKKRPIAWQLQSGKFTARKSPAFACLVYYHKLDDDTLPKIRSQYVGPLRQRLETELRGIQSVAADARSDRQEKRRVELEDGIRELTDFDAKLAQVAREGFATAGLEKLLSDEPLDLWCSLDGKRPHPMTTDELIAQEASYAPDINDGVRVNIAPLQKAGLLATDVLAKKDVENAITDRAEWRADERRWVREGKLPQPGWWPVELATPQRLPLPNESRTPFQQPAQYPLFVLLAMIQKSGGTAPLIRLARAYSLLTSPETLVNDAPAQFAEIARQWANTYVESPQLGFFRDAIMDLVQRNQLHGPELRRGTASLVASNGNLQIESWVMFDAEIALAIVDALHSPDLEEAIPDELSDQVQALMAG